MNVGKTVFAQILEHLPRYEFNKFVKKYKGNHRVQAINTTKQQKNQPMQNLVVDLGNGIIFD